MVDKHDKIFFGQNSAISVVTFAKEEPYFLLRCIKKKSDGSWEKPSKGEGKSVRLSLDELVMILHVLREEISAWSTTHKYKDQQTTITVNWSSGPNEEKKELWIVVAEYRKMMNVAQAEVLKLLLEHILKEKIEFSTVPQAAAKEEEAEGSEIVEEQATEQPQTQKEKVEEEIVKPSPKATKAKKEGASQNGKKNGKNALVTVSGTIEGNTDKAIKVVFTKEGFDAWLPKSKISSKYDINSKDQQNFTVEAWIIEKRRQEVKK